VLTGPRAYLTGCTVEDNVFLATGTTVFNGARIGTRSEVRVNAVVHLRTRLPPDTTVPIGWIAVGDPAQLFALGEHERLWQVQRELDFPGYVFGLARAAEGETAMPELTRRYTQALGQHLHDRTIGGSAEWGFLRCPASWASESLYRLRTMHSDWPSLKRISYCRARDLCCCHLPRPFTRCAWTTRSRAGS
jgi:hypothetical protein